MSQNSTALPTTGTLPGLLVVTKVNDALDTVASHESGAGDPGAIGAYRDWADTTTGLLKQRNTANSGWLIRDTLAETFAIAKSAGFTVALADYRRLFKCTGSFTILGTAAASLGDGFNFEVANVGSGTVVFDPNSSELVDGASTITLAPGQSCRIWCDGSAFTTVGRGVAKLSSSARSSNTILAAGDNATVISATTTFTQTLTAAATLGDGWFCDYRNDGTGIITLDPNSTEQIDGRTTRNLYQGESCRITCNGTGFKTVGLGTGMVLIDRQVVSSPQATVTHAALLTADFNKYVGKFSNVLPVTSGANLVLRISQAGVVKSGANDYQMQGVVSDSGAGVLAQSSGATGINLTAGIVNTGTRCASGDVEIIDPSNTTATKEYLYKCRYVTTGASSVQYIVGSADFPANTSGSPNAAQDGIQYSMSSGNIAQGVFELYGIR